MHFGKPFSRSKTGYRQVDTDHFVKPSVFEKILNLIPITPLLGSVIVALVSGPLGNFFFLYFISNDFYRSLYSSLWIINAGESGFINEVNFIPQLLIANLLWYSFIFYLVFSIGRLRSLLINKELHLVSLAQGGKNTVNAIFKNVSNPLPQLAIAGVFLLIYGSSAPQLMEMGVLIPANAPIYLLRSLFRSIIFGSFLWIYGSSLWSLYRFGQKPLRLRSYHEDPMLGLRELGSLSFSYSLIYFTGLGIFVAHIFFANLIGYIADINLIFLLLLPPLGIALFISPLISFHKKMVEAKNLELERLRKEYTKLMDQVTESGDPDLEFKRLIVYDSLERKVAAIPTWPYESPLMGKLVIIMLSVTASIIARYIMIFLKI